MGRVQQWHHNLLNFGMVPWLITAVWFMHRVGDREKALDWDYLSSLFTAISPYYWASMGIYVAIAGSILGAAWCASNGRLTLCFPHWAGALIGEEQSLSPNNRTCTSRMYIIFAPCSCGCGSSFQFSATTSKSCRQAHKTQTSTHLAFTRRRIQTIP
jgi:hypothetical protein